MSDVDVIEKYRTDNFFVGRSPSPEAMRDIRLAFRISQKDAARTIYITPQAWGQCERGWRDYRLSAMAWELFLIKNWHRLARSPDEIIEISRAVT